MDDEIGILEVSLERSFAIPYRISWYFCTTDDCVRFCIMMSSIEHCSFFCLFICSSLLEDVKQMVLSGLLDIASLS